MSGAVQWNPDFSILQGNQNELEEEEKEQEEEGGHYHRHRHHHHRHHHHHHPHHHLLPVPSYNNNDPFQTQHLADLSWVTITSHQDMVTVAIKIPDLKQTMQRQNQRKRKETETDKME